MATPEPKEDEALAWLAKVDPDGAEIVRGLLRALTAELAANRAAPRLYTRGEGTWNDLPDYCGPYERPARADALLPDSQTPEGEPR